MIFDFGDVVVVPFPFTDQSGTKKRPAVVISDAAFNRDRPDVVFMAITSRIRPESENWGTVIEHWQAAGLRRPSAVKPLIATLERGLLSPPLGKLAERDAEAVRRLLNDIIGNAQPPAGA